MTAAHQLVPVTYRSPTPDDEGFIYNSWLKSLHDPDNGSPWAKMIRAQVFYANHKKVIAKILSEAGVLLACNPECTEQILGYGVYQPTSGKVAVLHYLYVKHPYRRLGIATGLFRTMLHLAEHDTMFPVVASHATSAWWHLKDKWNLIYNPYVIGATE